MSEENDELYADIAYLKEQEVLLKAKLAEQADRLEMIKSYMQRHSHILLFKPEVTWWDKLVFNYPYIGEEDE